MTTPTPAKPLYDIFDPKNQLDTHNQHLATMGLPPADVLPASRLGSGLYPLANGPGARVVMPTMPAEPAPAPVALTPFVSPASVVTANGLTTDSVNVNRAPAPAPAPAAIDWAARGAALFGTK